MGIDVPTHALEPSSPRTVKILVTPAQITEFVLAGLLQQRFALVLCVGPPGNWPPRSVQQCEFDVLGRMWCAKAHVMNALKKGQLATADLELAKEYMLQLNDFGSEIASCRFISTMTDVTGFGLLGHLIELCDASSLSAEVRVHDIPILPNLHRYVDTGMISGGTQRNFTSYGDRVSAMDSYSQAVLCDPQTSGGLLIAVDPEGCEEFCGRAKACGMQLQSFGRLSDRNSSDVTITVL